ncbi:MAG: MBL fold metallo-hydrolase, partial [Candidatus Thorarchaeota archaeon]
IALDNFIVVIDTLYYPVQSREFRKRIEEKYNLPVKHVFLSHFHGDHVFGTSTFKDVEIFGSSQLIENLEKRKEENWTPEAFDTWKEGSPEYADYIDEIDIIIPKWGFDQKHIISDNQLRIEFYHSGGSTGCSAYAYFPAQRVLVTGDDLVAEDWPFLTEACGSPEKMIQAFNHMLSLDPDIVIPGHGKIVGKSHIQEHLDFLNELIKRVKAGIEIGTTSEELELPEFYEPCAEWKITSALKHMYNFYAAD